MLYYILSEFQSNRMGGEHLYSRRNDYVWLSRVFVLLTKWPVSVCMCTALSVRRAACRDEVCEAEGKRDDDENIQDKCCEYFRDSCCSTEENDYLTLLWVSVYSTQWWALDRGNLRWVSCWCLSSSAHVRMRLGYVYLWLHHSSFSSLHLFSSRAPSVRTPFSFTLSVIMWAFTLLCCATYVRTASKEVYWCSCRLAVCTDIQALQC